MADDNDELDDFIQEVDQIANILKNLNSEDAPTRDAALNLADSKLNEFGKIKYDRTVINHEAFKHDIEPPGVSLPELPPDDPRKQEIFMSEMEKDVKKRTKRRKQNENEAKLFKEKASEDFAAGRYEEAIDSLSHAIRLVRDSPLFYTSRAEAYMKCRMYEDALRDCDDVLFFCENDEKAILIKADALFKLEKHDDAVVWYEKAFNLYPLRRKSIKKMISDVKRSQEWLKRRDIVLQLFKDGDANLCQIEESLTKLRSENIETFHLECVNLAKLITNDDGRVFLGARNAFSILFEKFSTSECPVETWGALMDVFDVAVKQNEGNQKIVLNLRGFTQQLRRVLSVEVESSNSIYKTLNFVHTLSCEESGRRIVVNNIGSSWLLEILMQNSSEQDGIGELSISILNNMALDENFRLKLDSSFDTLLTPKFRNLLSEKHINATLITYFGNLALSDTHRATLAKQEAFWANCVTYLETFNKSEESGRAPVVDALLGLMANLARDRLPYCISPQVKGLIQQLVLLINSKRTQTARIYLVLSRVVNSFDGCVKILLNLNFLQHLMQIIQNEETALTNHTVRILVSLTRISKKSQKEVAKNCLFMLKLLKSQDESVVGNAALCLSYSLVVPKLSSYLTQTDVMDVLLSVIKKDNTSDNVKKNVGQLLAKLAKSEPEHLQQLRKLRGIEILHSCMNFYST